MFLYTVILYKKRHFRIIRNAEARFLLLDLSEIFNGTNHLAGVAVLVIIPGNNLYLIGIIVNLGNHGLGSVEQRTVGNADNIRRYERLLGVTEGKLKKQPS